MVQFYLPAGRNPLTFLRGVHSPALGLFQPNLVHHHVGSRRQCMRPKPTGLTTDDPYEASADACRLVGGLPAYGLGLSEEELLQVLPLAWRQVVGTDSLFTGAGVLSIPKPGGDYRAGVPGFLSGCLVGGVFHCLGRHSTTELAARRYNRFLRENQLPFDPHPAGLVELNRDWVYLRQRGSDGITETSRGWEVRVVRSSAKRDGWWEPDFLVGTYPSHADALLAKQQFFAQNNPETWEFTHRGDFPVDPE
jgi:hypothetical protein